MLIGDALQRLQCRTAIGKQSVQAWLAGEVDLFGVDDLRLAARQQQGAELTVAAQAFIKQRLLLFDQFRFQQQRADFTGRAFPGDTPGLAQPIGRPSCRESASIPVAAEP